MIRVYQSKKIKPDHKNVVYMNAFCEGLDNLGIEYEKSFIEDGYIKSDAIALFGWKKGKPSDGPSQANLRTQLIEAHDDPSSTYVMERGYIKRDSYYSIGIGGFNGIADFKNSNSDDKRWLQLDQKLGETNWEDNKLVLVCGQVLNDASLRGINYAAWVYRTIKYIMDYGAGAGGRGYDVEIAFRYHPLYKNRETMPLPIPNAKKLILDTDESFTDLLNRCRYTVSFNSNIGVESILAGVPTISFDERSMVWNISSHDAGQPYMPTLEERKQWAFDLAYSQWTLEEIKAGLPHRHLKIYND